MAGYGDNAALDAYLTEVGYVLPEGTTDAQKTAGRQRGSLYIDRFEPQFTGSRTGGYQQDRAWPRTTATTYYGEVIDSVTVPTPVVNASFEAAYLEIVEPGSLAPIFTPSEQASREKVGPLEVEYKDTSFKTREQMIALSSPVILTIEGLLWPFLVPPQPAVMVV